MTSADASNLDSLSRSDVGWWAASAVGAASLGTGLMVAEVLAGASRPSPVVAVGDAVIDLAPGPVQRWAIDVFGTADKPVLVIGTILVLAMASFAIARAALSSRLTAALGCTTALGVIGALAAAASATGWAARAAAVLPSLGGTAASCAVLLIANRLLGSTAFDDTARPTAMAAGRGDRRALLGLGAAWGAATGAAALGITRIRGGAEPSVELVRLPPAGGAPSTSTPLDSTPGISPFYTPTDAFYRIDTALVTPRVDPTTWRLRVHGMVDNELDLDWNALVDEFPLVTADITISCVSNEVGGELVGNARWRGVRLDDVLERAGTQSRADQVVGRSIDGFTAGFPVAAARDGRDALIALEMNGAPLTRTHGAPARLVVPGLYGYISATKWLTEIELTRFDEFEGYWIPRGWSAEGPVKTQSRIDTPRAGATINAARTAIAGVAWAPHRGIERVEVRVDDGPWIEARLAPAPSSDTWRQWVYEWEPDTGLHTIAVRATDANGDVQTSETRPVAPDGATGHHTIRVTVEQ